MSHAAIRQSTVRRVVALAVTVLAVFALAIPPAHANGYLRAARAIELSGDRTHVRTNLKVTNPAPYSELGVYFGLGAGGETVGVRMVQGGSDRASRSVNAYAYGNFFKVIGENCAGETAFMTCYRDGFNWQEDQAYRVVVDRGGHNENGWLWTVKIVNLSNDNVTPLLSVRTPTGQLHQTANLAFMNIDVPNCENLNTLAGNVTKPRRQDGSPFAWGAKDPMHEGCSTATTAAPVEDGVLYLRIAE